MNERYIGFSSQNGEPWDKLKQENFKTGKTFTTFRGYGPKKDKWYEEGIGEIFNVSLDRKLMGKAKLIEKNYIWSNEIPLSVIQSDTFKDFTLEKWNALMEDFYGNRIVFGYLLTFEITAVDNHGQK